MKDQVFSGRDVEEALASAGRALGLPQDLLRYVVLDPGAPERQAQVAVLLDRGGKAPGVPGPAPAGHVADPRARLRALIRMLAETADIDLEAEVEDGAAGMRVQIRGEGSAFLLGQRGEVLRALQHLLQRALGHESPGRLLLECEGYRELRDAELKAHALETATAVREDGRPRVLGALNSYERRIVHLALADAPGIRTYSVGEGSERRVTIAPSGPGSGGV